MRGSARALMSARGQRIMIRWLAEYGSGEPAAPRHRSLLRYAARSLPWRPPA